MRGVLCRELKGERRKRELRSLAQTVKEQADQEASVEPRSTQSSYRSRRRTPTRPLLGYHRQHHFRITQSWSDYRTPGTGTTSSLHSHQWSARVMRGCGSGDGCRRARRPDDGLRWLRRGILADAVKSIARRRNRQVGKKTIDLQTLTNRERNPNSHKHRRSPARTTHNAVRVAHTERLSLATVNVKSLKPKEISRSHKFGADTNSTIDQIDRDMSLHGCHVVGVQESCIKGNVTREQQNFVAYTSGANGRGQLGVEAWVHRSVLMRARVRTEPCSPRLLVLKIDGRNINLTVIVAHAPPNDSGEQGRKSFWSSLRKAAKAVPRARPLALLIDAKWDEWEVPRADSLGAVPVTWENANGSEFRRALEERNLLAVSTFTPVYQPTWWSGRAQHRGRRIDYVAVSSDWTDDAAKPMTLPAIQLPGESVDHVPARASMLWPQFSPGDQKSISRKHDSWVLDPWLINCPDARSWFQHCTSLPVFLHCSPWHSVVWWTKCTALRTARCIGAQHLVLVTRHWLQSRENLGRVKELLP